MDPSGAGRVDTRRAKEGASKKHLNVGKDSRGKKPVTYVLDSSNGSCTILRKRFVGRPFKDTSGHSITLQDT